MARLILEKPVKYWTEVKIFIIALLAVLMSANIQASDMDATSKASFDTVMAFMGAVGSGDMETVNALMADDMIWQNEGDSAMPWIGPWKGKDEITKFLGVFS